MESIDRELLGRIMRQVALQRTREPRPCAICGGLMAAAYKRQRYCSPACSQRAYRQRKRELRELPDA